MINNENKFRSIQQIKIWSPVRARFKNQNWALRPAIKLNAPSVFTWVKECKQMYFPSFLNYSINLEMASKAMQQQWKQVDFCEIDFILKNKRFLIEMRKMGAAAAKIKLISCKMKSQRTRFLVIKWNWSQFGAPI